MRTTLTIDLRKLTHSGIGRYLQNIVPPVLPGITASRIQLLGRPDEIALLGALPGNVSLVENASAPHSLAEQRLAWSPSVGPKPGERRVLWVPHYNIPLFYTGPLVCTVHDTTPLDLKENFGAGKRLLAQVLLSRVAQRASVILTPSAFSRDRILARLRVPERRVVVTPLAVDTRWPSLQDAPPPHVEAEPFLLFVGNLKANKNLVTLLEALVRMGERAPLLLVAGRVDGFRTADDAARRLAERLAGRVRLMGEVSEEQLIRLYRGAAAFVMPSLYEGFGYPVLEAMRYGCPVVVSNASSLPEVAGEAALLFDPRDAAGLASAILKVMEPAERTRLAAAGIAREAQFTYGPAVAATTAALDRVLEGR